MKSAKRPRPLLLFYILVVYVLIQFGWWAYMLIHLNDEVSDLRSELILQQLHMTPSGPGHSTLEIAQAEMALQEKLQEKHLMIIGEGAVFLVLLVLGILRTRNSFKKEAALNAQQRNFILSVTHELKSPLASVRLQLETIQKRVLPKEKQEEVLSGALQDTDRLNALVENILTAARIDNHTIRIDKETKNLSDEVNGLAEKAAAGVARHHRLTTDVQENVFAPFDPIGFHSIFMNLLENAVKYSPAGSEIGVSLRKAENAVVFAVSDRGPGISGAEKENVFRRFYRLGNEETRTTKGTGLGLYIVRSLAEAHGGSVRVLDHEGGGSIFEITLPA